MTNSRVSWSFGHSSIKCAHTTLCCACVHVLLTFFWSFYGLLILLVMFAIIHGSFDYPQNFKFKPLFPFLASVVTIVESVDVEMITKTLIFDIIDLASKLKKPLIPSLKFQSLVVKKKNCDHESTHHFQDWWVTKLPWVESMMCIRFNVKFAWKLKKRKNY